ncbi:hypothetical protein STEG23_011686, partial [Scotinomys teguina]
MTPPPPSDLPANPVPSPTESTPIPAPQGCSCPQYWKGQHFSKAPRGALGLRVRPQVPGLVEEVSSTEQCLHSLEEGRR